MPGQPHNTLINVGPYCVQGFCLSDDSDLASAHVVSIEVTAWQGSMIVQADHTGPGFTHNHVSPDFAEQLGRALIEAARVARGGKP